jgi:hypothetical protein
LTAPRHLESELDRIVNPLDLRIMFLELEQVLQPSKELCNLGIQDNAVKSSFRIEVVKLQRKTSDLFKGVEEECEQLFKCVGVFTIAVECSDDNT